MLILVLAGTATALATGLGAVPVFLLGRRAESLRPALWGLAAGALFLIVSRAIVDRSELAHGTQRGVGVRASVLVFVVLLVHSLPEGFAIGTAYASDTEGLALFVILAIAIQNIPEGTSVAIPMEAAGASRSRQFWAAVATSAPQPVGAVLAYLLVEEIEALLPFSFAFAAGAMLGLVVAELLPDAVSGGRWLRAAAGFAVGAGVMLAASAALSV